MRTSLAPLLALAALLGACATPEGEYPTLAIRDVERVAGQFDVPEPEPAQPPSPETVTDAEQIAERAREAHRRFLEQANDLRPRFTAAGVANVGSDAWARAEVALATLQSTRSEAIIALADLDRLYVDAALQGLAVAPLGTIREEIAALVADEDRLLAALTRELYA